MMLLSACCVAGHWMFPSMQSAGAKRNCLVRLWQRTNPSCSAARGGERMKQPCILPKVAAAIRKSSPRWMKLISANGRSEEHTSELQSLMRISYAVFCLKKKNKSTPRHKQPNTHKHI